ncbi:MAG: hypothetical protein LRY72_09030 [Saccharospirillaceae bacterium]|nr:hypothetical protein [Saccharospirillaceae bacterium]
MSSYCIRPASTEDSPALLRLLAATAQQGSIRLTFERHPDYFYAAAVSNEQPDIWVMEKPGHGIIATFSIGQRRVFINGQPTTVRYGSDLRIHPDFQGGRTLYRLFGTYRQQMQHEWMQTVILDENRASLSTVGSGRNSLPHYLPAGMFTTCLISLRRKKTIANDPLIHPAGTDDIEEMQAFFDREAASKQFYPCYDFSRIGSDDPYYRNIKICDFFILREQGEITALAGLWDQKDFKQTRISGYTPLLRHVRLLYNSLTRLTGHLALPAINSLNHYLMLHSVVVKQNDPQRFARLLKTIRKAAQERNAQALACGFDNRDPLLQVARSYRGHALKSRNFIATYQPKLVQQLDLSRLQYPEISRL